jgi:cobalt/nickel transport system permease protein
MHISEGVLSPPVLVAGAVLTAAGVAMGLKKMDLYSAGRPFLPS